MLLGGATDQYQKMYERALSAMKEHIFYRPMLPEMNDILFAGSKTSDGKTPLDHLIIDARMEHLTCFVPGMIAIGSELFNSGVDMGLADKLVQGCMWAYENAPLGVQPEIFHTVSCGKNSFCSWDEKMFEHAVEAAYSGSASTPPPQDQGMPGVTKIDDPRYILRPEAIESVFIMYRITGATSFQDHAWKMFESIIKHTKTSIAHAALHDCTVKDPPMMDRMESFWLAETLKYFYLIFADEELVSLDEYVLNTEAHPLKRRRPAHSVA